MYLTEKEIMTQHEALQKTFAHLDAQKEQIESFFDGAGQRKFVFMGCGSSYMLAKSMERMFMTRPDTCACSIAGGDYIMNPEGYHYAVDQAVVVMLSRSGLTSEVLLAADYMREHENVKIAAVTMREGSALAAKSDFVAELPWAFDDSVCQTRNVTNLYTAGILLNAFIYGDCVLAEQIKDVIDRNEAYKIKYRPLLEEIAKRDFDHVIVLADGVISGLAEEAALAFTEIAMIGGNCYNLLDYRHGPIVLNNPRTLNIIAVQPQNRQMQTDMIRDVHSHGGIVITVGMDEECYGGDFHICTGETGMLGGFGIPFIYVAQMLAYAKAIELGGNPDAPQGLNPYIKL